MPPRSTPLRPPAILSTLFLSRRRATPQLAGAVAKIKLYPGNLEDDLKNLNEEGARKNKSWTNVTKREWTSFWGLMLASTQYQERGLRLWSSTSPGITTAPNFGRFMSDARFRGIRMLVPWAKADLPSVHKDGWAWFREMVAEFNTNREAVLGVLQDATLDESMSAWQPRASKKGGLPNLSFVARKPWPLNEHGNLAYRDITRGKLCSNYFAAAPKVDNHIQSRQFDLKLEKRPDDRPDLRGLVRDAGRL
eukprot:jgi/Tetstr1/428569/TSEL_018563.t1